MDEQELERYVARVAGEAERIFGARLSPDLLKAYAREAVLDLWLREADITVSFAELALNQVLGEVARRTGKSPAETERAA